KLCEQFLVSRPTVREAVKALVSAGILEIRRGKGTYVSLLPGLAKDPLGLDFVMGPDFRLALIEARLIIEPGVARLAAKNAEDRDIERVAKSVRDMEEIVYRRMVDVNAELDFHRSIAEATKNPVIMRLVPVIMDSIVKTYSDAPRTSGDHRHALEEHSIILRALAARNAEGAYSAMQHHLEMSYRRTMEKRSASAAFGAG
ncbi:MAG TPA: FadR/GntR family transcriptional regulator, partial [Magnetospirillaceae bacterium]|nr:FadR/GntR family transcriptional regulator [Magnetospirillaceae bacterium]